MKIIDDIQFAKRKLLFSHAPECSLVILVSYRYRDELYQTLHPINKTYILDMDRNSDPLNRSYTIMGYECVFGDFDFEYRILMELNDGI